MNNEELILQILTDVKQGQELLGEKFNNLDIDVKSIKTDVDGIKSDVTTLKADVEGIKSDVTTLKSDVEGIKSDITTLKSDVDGVRSEVQHINIHLENETDKNLSELIAVFTPKAQQFEDATEKIGSLLFDMDSVKRVMISHSKAIQELQAVNK